MTSGWLKSGWIVAAALASMAGVQSSRTLPVRGHAQTLHIYGPPQGRPVIVSSGDGGWIHLGPHVAEALAGRGWYVVGFDVRAYLASFTTGQTTLNPADEPTDYRVLVDFASQATRRKPILIGVSEGAGLSVLAATDPSTKSAIGGVVALGLPDLNELGWRWKDALIYLTHKVPDEPTFRSSAIVANVAPVPLAVIHSTHDEFVSVADIQRIVERAAQPKRLWTIDAVDHRFSDKLAEFDRTLLEAIEWLDARSPR